MKKNQGQRRSGIGVGAIVGRPGVGFGSVWGWFGDGLWRFGEVMVRFGRFSGAKKHWTAQPEEIDSWQFFRAISINKNARDWTQNLGLET